MRCTGLTFNMEYSIFNGIFNFLPLGCENKAVKQNFRALPINFPKKLTLCILIFRSYGNNSKMVPVTFWTTLILYTEPLILEK